MLNELETLGWTTRQRDTADRRRHVVDLTDEGHKVLKRAQAAQTELEDEILAGLDAEERDQLRELLRKALTRLGERQPAAAEAAQAS
jgi:DNA-binding MarR family transcriptional regulator